jgi:hypothetical protein
MKGSQVAVLLAGCGLASTYPGISLRKRWDYDMCDCTLGGVPLPDESNFQLPLEDLFQEQCPPLYLGDAANPQATSKVCLYFVGTNMYFNFSSFPDYTTNSASVTWKLKGNHDDPATWTSPPPDQTLDCSQADPGSDFNCKLPFNEILAVPGTTSVGDLMSGMCPNGDSKGLVFYFEFSGTATEDTYDAEAVPFQGRPPCKTRTADRKCTCWDGTYDYVEVSYRCSKCEHACTVNGSAFGFTFDFTSELELLSGQDCHLRGYYSTASLLEMQTGQLHRDLLVDNIPGFSSDVGEFDALVTPALPIPGVDYRLNVNYRVRPPRCYLT